MERYYLIVDIGTGNSRVALVTSTGKIIDMDSFENVYERDNLYEDAQFFTPGNWRKRIFEGCKKVINAHKDLKISGISASGARETIVCYDEAGNDFLGLPNIDNRGAKWMDEIPEKSYVYEKTGRWCTEDFPAAKLMGFRKMHKEEFAKIKKITSLSEWVGEMFTGKIVIEPSMACETQLFDIDDMKWSEKICGFFKIPMDILPEVMNASESLGKITKKVSDELGIDENAEFIIGGADTQLAAKAMNVKVGDICICSGTTSPVVTILDKKYYDDKERCWTDLNLGGKTFQVETNPGVTGNNFQRFKKVFFPNTSYPELDDILAAKTDFICTATFSSLNFTQRKSLKKGGFVMRAPFPQNMDLGDYALAVLSDIACSIYVQYNNLCEMIPNSNNYILGCGGGFKQKYLCHAIADLTGRELRMYEGFDQATVLGCVKLCNEHFGIDNKESTSEPLVYKPNSNPDSLIERYFREWRINRNTLNP